MDTSHTDSTTHQLMNGFSIVKADPAIFANFYTVYKNTNPFHRFTWADHLRAISEQSPCWWVHLHGKRVGGVLMQAGMLQGLFLEPPYTDLYAVLAALKPKVLEWTPPAQPIVCHGAIGQVREEMQRHGFRVVESKRCMIRPAEHLDYTVPSGFEFVTVAPDTDEHVAAAELMNEAFAGGAGRQAEFAEHLEITRDFYHKYTKRSVVCTEASTLVYHRESGELAAICHCMEWEGWPMIDDVAVRPKYQGHGLATALLRRAISVVAPHYPVMRLFVTVGNPAQSVYYRLGFLPGPEFSELMLPPR